LIGPSLQTSLAAWFVTWGGLVFDLLIGFCLSFRATRLWAIPFLFIFPIANHFLFHIGIFP